MLNIADTIIALFNKHIKELCAAYFLNRKRTLIEMADNRCRDLNRGLTVLGAFEKFMDR
jgi:hypothetical protein